MYELFALLQTSEERKIYRRMLESDWTENIHTYRPTLTLTGIKEFQTPHSPWIFLLPLTISIQIPVVVASTYSSAIFIF